MAPLIASVMMLSAPKYLMLDSRNIEKTEGVEFVLGEVRKAPENPLFGEDRPWEVRFDNLYANVAYDDREEVFKLWYNPFIIDEVTTNTPEEDKHAGTPYRPKKREMGICYAVSKDGLTWTKPDLGIVEFDGSTENNLVLRHIHGAGVFVDEHTSDAAARYKTLTSDSVATSPDGLHWTPPKQCPEIEAAGDTHNNALWVDELDTYVGITRLWNDGQRIVGRTASKDYQTWTKAVEVLRGDKRRQTYAMPVFRYANVFLGLVMVFDTAEDMVDCELAWSPDTVEWERVCAGTPLIPRGPEGSFDSGCVYGAAYPIVKDGEILLYYGGSNGPHTGWRDGALGLARLRLDGFAGLKAADKGVIVTRPMVCDGNRLLVSADAADGSVRVGVVGAPGLAPGNSQAVASDVSDESVTWQHGRDLASLKGKTVQLRFELESATVYAFGFGD